MDRLTSLTVFGRVVDAGGFSAAARRLEMSVTMVSNHVQALEDRLGARLLNRTTRKVSLTEVGKAYYDRCIQILADLEQADDIAGALHSTPRGTPVLPRPLSPWQREATPSPPVTAATRTSSQAPRRS